jgi:hypothetical protein
VSVVGKVIGGHLRDLSILDKWASEPLGANLSAAEYPGASGVWWFDSDLTANNNQGEFDIGYSVWASSNTGDWRTVTFKLYITGSPTQAVQLCRNSGTVNGVTRRLKLNTDRKLEWRQEFESNVYGGSTVLSVGAHTITIECKWSSFDSLPCTWEERIWLDGSLEIEVIFTQEGIPEVGPAGTWYGLQWFAEDLGASNPGIHLYTRDFVEVFAIIATDSIYHEQVAHANAFSTSGDEFSKTGAEAYYQHIDDRPENDATDYLYTNAATRTQWANMTQRQSMGIGADDATPLVSPWWRIRSRADSGTKWAVNWGRAIPVTNPQWTALANPGSSWVWFTPEAAMTGYVAANFDNWQLGLQTTSPHDIYIDWSTVLAWVVYHNESYKLEAEAPPAARRIFIC